MKSFFVKLLAKITTLAGVLLFLSCATTNETVSEQSAAEAQNFVENLDFVFVTDLNETMGTAFLTSNVDFMKMKGDTLRMELPYHGTSHVARFGGGRGGLRFRATATDIRTRRSKKDKYFDLDFRTRHKAESFSCKLRVFPSGRALLSINSSQRSNAQYEGLIRPSGPQQSMVVAD